MPLQSHCLRPAEARPEGTVKRVSSVLMTGQLGHFSLVELLQLLAGRERSGLLTVDHPKDEARLWLKDGDIVHAEFAGRTGRNAIYGLLADEQGSYRFTDDVTAPRRSIDVSSEELLLDAIRRTDASRGRSRNLRETYIGDAVPTVQLSDGFDSSLELKPEEVNFLRFVDGRRSVNEIADLAELTLLEVRQIISQLLHIGALKVTEHRPRTARLVCRLDSSGLGPGEAGIDRAILASWKSALGYRPERVACRSRRGRVMVFAAVPQRKLGPFILLSRDTLLQNDLAADAPLLVKPVPRRPVRPLDS